MDPQPADLRLARRWMSDYPIITMSGEIDICTEPAVRGAAEKQGIPLDRPHSVPCETIAPTTG